MHTTPTPSRWTFDPDDCFCPPPADWLDLGTLKGLVSGSSWPELQKALFTLRDNGDEQQQTEAALLLTDNEFRSACADECCECSTWACEDAWGMLSEWLTDALRTHWAPALLAAEADGTRSVVLRSENAWSADAELHRVQTWHPDWLTQELTRFATWLVKDAVTNSDDDGSFTVEVGATWAELNGVRADLLTGDTGQILYLLDVQQLEADDDGTCALLQLLEDCNADELALLRAAVEPLTGLEVCDAAAALLASELRWPGFSALVEELCAGLDADADGLIQELAECLRPGGTFWFDAGALHADALRLAARVQQCVEERSDADNVEELAVFAQQHGLADLSAERVRVALSLLKTDWPGTLVELVELSAL